MADTKQKRKEPPRDVGSNPVYKKSKGGSGGRWKTPHHKVKMAEKIEMGTALNIGDQGIWVTFARGMRSKAIREFKDVCDEYGETMYGIEASTNEAEKAVDKQEEDIEACIEAELKGMRAQAASKQRQTFTPVSSGLDCLFFMKTMKPIKPGDLAQKMCQDARDCLDPRQRKCKYINRLTPVSDMDKATDKGIMRVARLVLSPWFALNHDSAGDGEPGDQSLLANATHALTYAIRHNIRNHATFKSEEVIKKIAGLIDDRHKVNLGQPDKVILVEIFQHFCGISVVDGKEWEALKRYNLNALYDLAAPEGANADQR